MFNHILVAQTRLLQVHVISQIYEVDNADQNIKQLNQMFLNLVILASRR